MPPFVSFVVPVRNDAQRLRNCLHSIAANAYPPEFVEIVVVDNASNDDSATVGRDAGAVVLTLTGNVASLRNAGAKVARGELLAFVDADHILADGWLPALAACMTVSGVAAAGAAYFAPPDGTWVQRCYDGLRVHQEGREETEWLASGNMAVRRAVFDSLGGFDTSLATCEDVDLCQRIHAAGHSIVSDSGLKSVHAGDPRTLKALFLGELWRGRDNLKASFRGPKDFRHLRSALIPVVYLAALALGVAGIFFRTLGLAAGCGVVLVALSGLRAAQISRRARFSSVVRWGQALVVATVYDAARALALIVRVGHQTRRSADKAGASSPAPLPERRS